MMARSKPAAPKHTMCGNGSDSESDSVCSDRASSDIEDALSEDQDYNQDEDAGDQPRTRGVNGYRQWSARENQQWSDEKDEIDEALSKVKVCMLCAQLPFIWIAFVTIMIFVGKADNCDECIFAMSKVDPKCRIIIYPESQGGKKIGIEAKSIPNGDVYVSSNAGNVGFAQFQQWSPVKTPWGQSTLVAGQTGVSVEAEGVKGIEASWGIMDIDAIPVFVHDVNNTVDIGDWLQPKANLTETNSSRRLQLVEDSDQTILFWLGKHALSWVSESLAQSKEYSKCQLVTEISKSDENVKLRGQDGSQSWVPSGSLRRCGSYKKFSLFTVGGNQSLSPLDLRQCSDLPKKLEALKRDNGAWKHFNESIVERGYLPETWWQTHYNPQIWATFFTDEISSTWYWLVVLWFVLRNIYNCFRILDERAHPIKHTLLMCLSSGSCRLSQSQAQKLGEAMDAIAGGVVWALFGIAPNLLIAPFMTIKPFEDHSQVLWAEWMHTIEWYGIMAFYLFPVFLLIHLFKCVACNSYSACLGKIIQALCKCAGKLAECSKQCESGCFHLVANIVFIPAWICIGGACLIMLAIFVLLCALCVFLAFLAAVIYFALIPVTMIVVYFQQFKVPGFLWFDIRKVFSFHFDFAMIASLDVFQLLAAISIIMQYIDGLLSAVKKAKQLYEFTKSRS